MLIIKNIEVYKPEYIGKKDLLICNEKIVYVRNKIKNFPKDCDIIEGENLILTPGFIDQHVHITGGGGEGGFSSRTPEIQLSKLIHAGITTVVGLLGTDGETRSLENLFAKVSALNEEGITAYMHTGAYKYPSPTITGSISKDIIFIKEILGLKLAISDHRASNITVEELVKLASEVRIAGMIAGKPGVIILHIGDDKRGLQPIFKAAEEGSIPISTYRPTHVNRNSNLIQEGYELLKMGGYIDYTCGLQEGLSPGECIVEAKKKNISLEHITISSDGQGSWSNYDTEGKLVEIGISGVDSLLKELTNMVNKLFIPFDEALTFFTSNVAKSLNLYPEKGLVEEGSDADILLLDKKNLKLSTMISKGQIMLKDGKLKKQGTYEERI